MASEPATAQVGDTPTNEPQGTRGDLSVRLNNLPGMIPYASVSPAILRGRQGVEVRQLRKPCHVWVEFNGSDVRAGLLLAWIKPEGGRWWGEGVVVDDGRLAHLAIGGSGLRPVRGSDS